MRYFTLLKELCDKRSISYSKIPSALREKLLQEDLIMIHFLSASKRKIVTKEGFEEYFKKLEAVEKAQTRAELAQIGSDTKQKSIAPQDGLYIVGDGCVNGIDLALLEEGALFLKQIPDLESDFLVVGVENFENLIYFKEQRYLFEQDQKLYFVFRNKKMLELFANVKNRLIYFGDFDLAGVAIYERSVVFANTKVEFFIPKNIEQLLKEYGSTKLYTQQLNSYKNLQSSNKKIQRLIELIHKYQKGLEQEFFIQ